MATVITIELDHLGPQEQRQARYLAALSRYRELSAQFTAARQEHGQADKSEVEAAREALLKWGPSPAERAHSIREVAAATSVSSRTIRRWAEEGRVWAEQRYGRIWYVDPNDVELMAETEGVPRRGWPLGRPRGGATTRSGF